MPKTRKARVDLLHSGFMRARKAAGKRRMTIDEATQLQEGSCMFCGADGGSACSVCGVAFAHSHCSMHY